MDEQTAGVSLVFSWWIAPILLLLGIAVRNIFAGINAEELVRKRCHEDVMKIRDLGTTTELWPVMADLFAQISADVPRVSKSVATEQVASAALRAIKAGFAQLADVLAEVEIRTAPLVYAASVHEQLVRLARLSACLSGALIVPLAYFSIRLVTPGLIPGLLLGIPLDALALALGCSLLTASAFTFGKQVTIYSTISQRVRALRPPLGGATS